MNSVQKSEHEKNLEHSKKRSRPSLFRPVSAPAKVIASLRCGYACVWALGSLAFSAHELGSSIRRPQTSRPGQEAVSGPWSGLKCTGEVSSPPRVLLICFPGSQDCEECHLLLEKPDGMLTLLLVTIVAVMGRGPGRSLHRVLR